MIAMSGALAGRKFVVHYTREATTGMLQEIWVLNPTERANRLWPTTERELQSWSFDPVAQTWSKKSP